MKDQKIAVVTGATKGIGLQVVKDLAARDFKVILTGRSDASVEKALEAAGAQNISGKVLDISDQTSVDGFFDWLEAEHGRIDVLVNNAGVDPGWHVGVLSTSANEMADIINNNALGAWRTIQRALPMMNAQGFGRIVNVASEAGILKIMGTGNPAYRLSKTAMNAITRIAANEATGDVKVNSVCPGWVRTDMGGENAHRSVEQGSASILWGVTLSNDGPNGAFYRDGEPLDW